MKESIKRRRARQKARSQNHCNPLQVYVFCFSRTHSTIDCANVKGMNVNQRAQFAKEKNRIRTNTWHASVIKVVRVIQTASPNRVVL